MVKRALKLSKVVKFSAISIIFQKCLKLHNFSAVFAIWAALNTKECQSVIQVTLSIENCIQVKQAISPKEKEKLSIQLQSDVVSNSAAYRSHLKNLDPPCVLHIG